MSVVQQGKVSHFTELRQRQFAPMRNDGNMCKMDEKDFRI